MIVLMGLLAYFEFPFLPFTALYIFGILIMSDLGGTMKKRENIIESVEIISEEDLLVQELDKRLSFEGTIPYICPCVAKAINVPTPSTSCGVRG